MRLADLPIELGANIGCSNGMICRQQRLGGRPTLNVLGGPVMVEVARGPHRQQSWFVSAISKQTARRLSHATGYIGLGNLNAASEELEAIEGGDRLSPKVMGVRCDLYMEAKNWELLIADAGEYARLQAGDEKDGYTGHMRCANWTELRRRRRCS